MSLNRNVNVPVYNVSVHENSTTGSPIASDPSDNETDSGLGEEEDEFEQECNTNRPVRGFREDAKNSPLESGGGGGGEKADLNECPAELKTLRYKIMLMNGNTPVEVAPPAKNTYANLQQFLEKEKNNNNKENWSKLNKSVKHKKIADFVTAYTASNELTEEEKERLLEVLKQNMLRGKLTKNKEVNYDKTKGVIKDMPCLVFNKTTRHFTIKNMDAQKHTTTIKKASFVKASGTTPTTTSPSVTDS